MYYSREENQQVICQLCPHHCKIHNEKVGICRVRKNHSGVLITENYARVASLALDPIEKKPLFHFHPGTMILSAGTYGCNLSCAFCQNYSLAHETPPTRLVAPQELLDIALECQDDGSIGIAFTYNEPSIWYEYIWDCAPLLKAQGLKVVLVTNGYIEIEPLQKLLPYVDAMNIDVKAFQEDFYRRLCKGHLSPVMKTVEAAVAETHVEVTALIVPGDNDDMGDIEAMASWLAALRKEIPLHLSRYHPAYRYTRPATPESTMLQAQAAARKHLPFVYLGNLGAPNHTLCQTCGAVLITRDYYQVRMQAYSGGCCSVCGSPAYFIIQD